MLLNPLIAGLILFVLFAVVGMIPMRRLIALHEAQHELRHGSASWIREVAGWTSIVLWLMLVWFVSTIIGDWAVSGDLDGAIARSWLRLRILLEIASALGDS
ncbi:MAG: hypothetical protein WBG95_16165 [Sulfitobacter sp.]